MMQCKKSPELILAVFFFISKVWNWIKIFVKFTSNDVKSHQTTGQFSDSSRNSGDCHTNDNKPSPSVCEGDDHHLHGEEACCDDDRHCDDEKEEDESYFFSDSDSDNASSLHPYFEDDCEDEKESSWSEAWSASASGFPDMKCQQRETLFDHASYSPPNISGQNNFVPESVFQKMGKTCNENKPSIESWFDSHLNEVWVNFLRHPHLLNPAPPDNPPLTEPLPPAGAEIPVKG